MNTFDFNDKDLTLSFSSIPLWEGVTKSKGSCSYYPISLGLNSDGLLVQLSEKALINSVVSAYKDDDYNFITKPPGSSNWANILGETYAKSICEILDISLPKKIIEIGAGSTYMADLISSKIDLDEYIIIDPTIHATSNEKLRIMKDYFPHTDLHNKKFDLVLSLNCLEHVTDPGVFLKEIAELMDNQSLAFIIIPDCERALIRGDINVILHEHLSYFTESSFKYLAKKHGLEVLTMNSLNDTFSILLKKAQSITLKSDTKQIMEHSSSIVKTAACSFNNLFKEKYKIIKSKLDEGKIINFHGATNGLNTFLFLTNLGHYPNVNIFDGDESKVDFYLPNCNKPILSLCNKSYAEGDYIVVSAISFYDQIYKSAITANSKFKDRVIKLCGVD